MLNFLGLDIKTPIYLAILVKFTTRSSAPNQPNKNEIIHIVMSTIATQPVVDHLKQDPILNVQNFVVVSFVNPKDKVVEKNLYYNY